MASPQTIQNAQFAFPVIAKDIPPEGQMGVSITYTLATNDFAQSFSYQIGSPSGFQMSQVVTLIIDNTQSPLPIQVTHGITNSTIQVPAGVEYIVPTFSNRGSYQFSIQSLAPPSSNVNVFVTFLNYDRLSEFGTSQNIVQGSSAIGSSFPNSHAQYLADQSFIATLTAISGESGGAGYTVTANLPSFNNQGYVITQLFITANALNVTIATGTLTEVLVSFGDNLDANIFGQWDISAPVIAGVFTGLVASVGNVGLAVPGSGFGVLSLTLNGTPSSHVITATGTISIVAYGVLLPMG